MASSAGATLGLLLLGVVVAGCGSFGRGPARPNGHSHDDAQEQEAQGAAGAAGHDRETSLRGQVAPA